MSGHHHAHVCEGRLMARPTVAIIGLGLIGASFAAALKAGRATGEIIGSDSDAASAEYCKKQGYIDRIVPPTEAAAMADIVVLAAPISALGHLAKTIAPALREGVVVTDVASVKEAAVAAIAPHLPEQADFVPAHPIAGKSVSGAQAADKELFRDRLTILTPAKDEAQPRAVAAVARLWEAAGARTERMASRNHDILYAYVSHLPQMMAYAACAALADEPLPAEVPQSFRRFVRLGGSDPVLWSEIAGANVESLTHGIAHVLATIDHMRNEFSDGEKKGAESKDSPQVAARFFPLLASAALVSVINQFEMQNKIALAPYAGTGFRDFTAPASEDPNEDISAISDSYAHVGRCLGRFHQALLAIHNALSDPSAVGQRHLLDLLQRAQQSHAALMERLETPA